ncbi:MAG TPA: DUF899 family protein [Acidimicrobiales bacterium]|nr:DUF899 family protein [Acidimicrobiales bacterium]
MGDVSKSSGSSGPEQLQARLRAAEVALAEERERVAARRDEVPPGPDLPDYVLRGVPGGENVHLSELFDGHNALVVYHLTGLADECCPSCSMWLDALNDNGKQVMDNAAFVVVATAGPDELALWALRRGFHQLRILSAIGSTFDRDLGFETPDGASELGLSVLVRQADQQVRLFYAVKAIGEDAGWHHTDVFSPVWQALDLLPHRGEAAVRARPQAP